MDQVSGISIIGRRGIIIFDFQFNYIASLVYATAALQSRKTRRYAGQMSQIDNDQKYNSQLLLYSIFVRFKGELTEVAVLIVRGNRLEATYLEIQRAKRSCFPLLRTHSGQYLLQPVHWHPSQMLPTDSCLLPAD